MKTEYYFIGIGGIGMSGLAQLLLQKKYSVSGSDLAVNQNVEMLIRLGAVIHRTHAAHHISPEMCVIYSSDIRADNPEVLAARTLGCKLLHRSELLAELADDGCSIAVAGTHGKTSTSAMLATLLINADYSPSYVIGGLLNQFQTNGQLGTGEYFILEADESDGSFLRYFPYGAIITNIDTDHLINYQGSLSRLSDAFHTFAKQVSSPQHLIWCRDDVHLTNLRLPGSSYGFSDWADWRISNLRQEGFKTWYDLAGDGRTFHDVEIGAPGVHQGLNSAAVFAMGYCLGLKEEHLRQGLANYQGVKRRCEKRGEMHGILFLDDYAHHPTAVSTTLLGIRQAIGQRRLIACFQPHRYSRTQDCLGSFGSIFDAADVLVVTDIYGAGELPILGISETLILDEVKEASQIECHHVLRPAVPHFLSQFVRNGDVVVTLGAGDITKTATETLNLLEGVLKV